MDKEVAAVTWGARSYVMGILNVTPDSFSGDGLGASGDLVARAVDQAARFVADGADILDVGGESTRPGSVPIGADEEIGRVAPVVARSTQEVIAPLAGSTRSRQ